MVKVTIGNNVSRNSILVSEDTTVREALETAEFDYTRGAMTLDGAPLQAGMMDKTFRDFGITNACYLISVVKADNA